MSSWSPDGTTIVFIDENKLFAIPAAGGAAPGSASTRQRNSPLQRGPGLAAGRVRLSRQRRSLVALDDPGGRIRWAAPRAERRRGPPSGRRTARGSHSSSASLTTSAASSWFAPTARTCARSAPAGAASRQGSRPGRPTGSCSTSAAGSVRPETDIFAVAPSGRVGRALTHPFPTGGTNDDAQGLVGARLTGQEQLPPTIAVRFKRKTTFARAIRGVATDGTRAVPTFVEDITALNGKAPALTVWNAASGRSVHGPVPCPGTYGPGLVALAGKRLAWLCGEGGNTYYVEQLLADRIGDRRAKGVASVAGDPNEGGDDIVNVLGSGATISFSVHRDFGRTRDGSLAAPSAQGEEVPWRQRLGSSRAVCRRLGRGAEHDGGRRRTGGHDRG